MFGPDGTHFDFVGIPKIPEIYYKHVLRYYL